MTVNIDLKWDSLSPKWDIFNKSALNQIPESTKHLAVIRYDLYETESGKLTVVPINNESPVVGTIGFTILGLKKVLNVKRLTLEARSSKKSLNIISQYLISLQ